MYETIYQVNGTDQSYPVRLDDFVLEECPVSVVSRFPEMDMLAQDVLYMHGVQETTGAVPYGTDSGKWPVRWYDAVRLAAVESKLVEQARDRFGKTLAR